MGGAAFTHLSDTSHHFPLPCDFPTFRCAARASRRALAEGLAAQSIHDNKHENDVVGYAGSLIIIISHVGSLPSLGYNS